MPFYQTKDLRKKLIFLGTPEVAAEVLRLIAQRSCHQLKIIAVVTKAPAPSKRGSLAPIPSPVHELAISLGIPVLTPETAKDPDFLKDIQALEPDLCLTAAYGHFLPQAFLSIPKFGTVNIHPSLLPLYRGASPVQRAIENGETETGVSLLFSTLKMDAGPLIAQEKYVIDTTIKTSELLKNLFVKGAELFVKNLPALFSENIALIEQDNTMATMAKKLKKEDGILNFSEPAFVCHNKVRAFDIWPKTTAKFTIGTETKELKIITTEVCENIKNLKENEVFIDEQTIDVCCGDKKVLKIKELQEPGKRVMTAKEFINGLRGKPISI